jgi:hypothetical protein
MTTLRGEMATSNADRYIGQLCDHLEKLSGGSHGHGHGGTGGPPVASVEGTATGALLRFPWGTCELTGESGALLVTIEAVDDQSATMAREMIGTRLNNFGNREGATLDWA